MASWREIDRMRKDPEGFRALAAHLLTRIPDLTDWERDNFLPSILHQSKKEEFTTRQSEKLLQIRDDYQSITGLPGKFRVRLILQACKEARFDLSEDDEAWILRKVAINETTIRRKDVGKLMRCARQVHAIEEEYADQPFRSPDRRHRYVAS
jgi:hypothetical protein